MANTELKTRILLRNDAKDNWDAVKDSVVLGKGEIGIEYTPSTVAGEANDLTKAEFRFKIGNGTSKWKDLPYYQEKIQNNITATYAFGKYSPDSSGSVTIPAKGQTLEQFLQSALAQAKDPVVTQPSVGILLTDAGAKEVGSDFTPSYSVSFNKGKYEYGPDTGITAEYAVSDTSGHTASTTTGSFAKFTVQDNTNYKISVTATYTEGAVPKNNLGSEVPNKKIAAGTKSATSNTVTGYRGWFYGYKTGDTALADASAITGAQLRVLTKSNGNFPSSLSTNKMKQMFFAAPKGKKASLSISNAVNGAPLTVQKTTVLVEGANNYTAIEYDVFYVSNAVAENGESKWTIK